MGTLTINKFLASVLFQKKKKTYLNLEISYLGSLRESRKAVTLEITIQKPMQVLLLTWRGECLTKYDPANNSYKLRRKYKMQ